MFTNVLNRRGRGLGAVAASLLAGAVFFAACKGEDNENPTTVSAGQTIVQLAGGNNQLTFLTAAVTRAGLGATLSGAGPFTVFAPTDAAFQAAGFANVAAVQAADPTTLSNILLYHVVSGSAVQSAAIPVAQTAYPTSLSANSTVYVTKTSSGSVSVNGARIITPDVSATNGVVHVIDQVLLPPAGNVLQVAQADTSLALLTAAALRGGTAVTTALGGTTPLTVFAPTNAAFRLTPYNSVSAITAADPTALAAVLTNHVIAGARAYSPTLANGPITTFGTGSLTVTVGSNNAISILSKGNSTNAANVLTGPRNRDITATNGVIHKIDRVLLP